MQNSEDAMIYHESDLSMRSHAAVAKMARIASKHHDDAPSTTRGTLLGDSHPKVDTCVPMPQDDGATESSDPAIEASL